MKPTTEQLAALDAFKTGAPLVLEAGAGAGKTSTLRMLAGDSPRSMLYTAFNRAIVTESAAKFGDNVTCQTVHSIANRYLKSKRPAVMKRLNTSSRQTWWDVANRLGVPVRLSVKVGSQDFFLGGDRLAVLVMQGIGRYCQSADQIPQAKHIPPVPHLDPEHVDGKTRGPNSWELANQLERYLAVAWADICSPQGRLRFQHDYYLKMWQLDHPRLPSDIVLLDEAQDANPVMVDVFLNQKHAQLVAVGDSQQAIYGFTGAVNAMHDLQQRGDTITRQLTKSFRFGRDIADVANVCLAQLGDFRISGHDIESTVGELDEPTCILFRTNAAVLSELPNHIEKRVAIAENLKAQLTAFCRAGKDLQQRGFTSYAELACFSSWDEVLVYAGSDGGEDLRPLVRLVSEWGFNGLLNMLERTVKDNADITLSTAHTSKGREWETVKLAGDFPAKDAMTPEEWRLLYVAATRAQRGLDISLVPALKPACTPS